MGKTGIITTENKNNEVYHDVITLFKIYRSVSWRMQVQIGQVKHRFQKEYGTDVDEFLESIYHAGMDINNDEAIPSPRGKVLLGFILYLYVGLQAHEHYGGYKQAGASFAPDYKD